MPWNFSFSYYTSLFTPLELESEQDLIVNPVANTFATCILDAKYKQANIHNVVFDQHHLLLDQWCDLFNILSKHKKLFDGSLGVYPHKKVHIDLKPGAKPVNHCAYPVPHVHCQTFKKELDHMVELGILAPCRASEWASPALLSLKKIAAYDKLQTYACSIKLSFENNTSFQSSQTCSITSLVTNSLPSSTSQGNSTLLNLTNQAKSFVSLSHPLANTNINVSL